MTIGYIGLGAMGGALAKRLQLTHPLFVYDLVESAVQALIDEGATRCASLSELASHCDTIMLCLPTSSHVHGVIFGESGLFASLKPGMRIIDQTSGDPNATRAMATSLAERGVALIDAPVSGGAGGAQAGTIAIMVGATPEQFAGIQPVLAAISPNVFHAGSVGAGHVIKLVNNLLSGGQRLFTLECVTLASKNGIDPAKAVEILIAGGARNPFLERFMSSHVLKGKLGGSGFTLELMLKDIRLACQLGSESGVPLLYGALTREMYQTCINLVGKDKKVNNSAVVMDQLAGTQIVPADYSSE